MRDWFVGEIRLFSHLFGPLPVGWMECAGQELLIDDYYALYALLFGAYGGDGFRTFRLPDLRGRTPVMFGKMPDDRRIRPEGETLQLGARGGQEEVVLTLQQMPPHRHSVLADTSNKTIGTAPSALRDSIPSTSTKPVGASATAPAAPAVYGHVTEEDRQALATGSVKVAGGSRPHENRQPFLPLRYAIAVEGIRPPARSGWSRGHGAP